MLRLIKQILYLACCEKKLSRRHLKRNAELRKICNTLVSYVNSEIEYTILFFTCIQYNVCFNAAIPNMCDETNQGAQNNKKGFARTSRAYKN